jgi:hypothetical protein
MIKAGDIIRAIGMGAVFVNLVEGASGEGEVLHVGYGDGTFSTTDYPEKAQYESMFPEQTYDGIFYRDNGNGNVLYLDRSDAEIIEVGGE